MKKDTNLKPFRKFFKTQAEQVMKSINVEICMGHSIGVSKSYYKPSEKDVLDDYLKAIDLLSVGTHNSTELQKEVMGLIDRNESNESLIKTKLAEKDDALNTLSDQVLKLMEEVKELKRGLKK